MSSQNKFNILEHNTSITPRIMKNPYKYKSPYIFDDLIDLDKSKLELYKKDTKLPKIQNFNLQKPWATGEAEVETSYVNILQDGYMKEINLSSDNKKISRMNNLKYKPSAIYTDYGDLEKPKNSTKVGNNKSDVKTSDPALQPTKKIDQLASNDEQKLIRQIPKGRYDTTYRREYLNFKNGVETTDPTMMERNANYTNKQEVSNDKANLNPFAILPPISSPHGQPQYQQNPTQFNTPPEPQQQFNQPPPNQANSGMLSPSADYLPAEPIFLSPHEEQSLIEDVRREFRSANTNQINQFYLELSKYDSRMTGFVHHKNVNSAVMKTNLPINEPLLRFIMSKYVSPNHERGHVNYNELVKFLSQCIQEAASYQNNPNQYLIQNQNQYMQQQYQQSPMNPLDMNSGGTYDPDEQAILRLMHENMREWDQVNLINIDNLRAKFNEVDFRQTQILGQSEIEDVCYRNRIPIQRSLIFQILEKYCKVSTGRYRWAAFVDFLQKLHHIRLPNKKKTDYTIRHDEKDHYSEKFTYRVQRLNSLKSKTSEEERLQEINKQITNLKNNKPDGRIGSSIATYVKGESWFTRYMRLANAIYTHRGNNYSDSWTLPKEEIRNLIKAYNSVFELNILPDQIEQGLESSLKGTSNNVVIDDLLKIMSRVNLNTQ